MGQRVATVAGNRAHLRQQRYVSMGKTVDGISKESIDAMVKGIDRLCQASQAMVPAMYSAAKAMEEFALAWERMRLLDVMRLILEQKRAKVCL